MTHNHPRARAKGRTLMTAAAFAMAAASASAVAADQAATPDKLSGSITITVAGGTYGTFIKQKVARPFHDRTGVTVNTVDGLTMQNLATLRATKNNPSVDVASFDPPGAFPAADEGLLLKLDPAKLPNMTQMYPWAVAKDGQLVGVLASNQCLAYNTKFIKTPPASWEDMWNPAYKGHVALPDISTSHGVMMLLIMSKIASNSSDLYDADKAFGKLETLKPNVLTYWTNHDQLSQLMNSGQVWLAPWTADRAATQENQGAPIDCVLPKEGAIFFTSFSGIARNSRNPDAAYAYLNTQISAQSQAEAANEIFLGPTNSDVKMTGKPLKYLDPTRAGLVRPDWDKVMQMTPQWTDIWNRRMQK
ncbi:MAG: ABC transporter substrate-binding protein [Mycobacterium sp.]|uniref:ABC transporter substrate-binding protein n=1 Tax=Mycobacterium sp. TaxID=1785 RepID=UPI00389B2681